MGIIRFVKETSTNHKKIRFEVVSINDDILVYRNNNKIESFDLNDIYNNYSFHKRNIYLETYCVFKHDGKIYAREYIRNEHGLVYDKLDVFNRNGVVWRQLVNNHKFISDVDLYITLETEFQKEMQKNIEINLRIKK